MTKAETVNFDYLETVWSANVWVGVYSCKQIYHHYTSGMSEKNLQRRLHYDIWYPMCLIR